MARKRSFALFGWILLFIFAVLIISAVVGHNFAEEMCRNDCEAGLVAPPQNPNVISVLLNDMFRWVAEGNCLFWCMIT